jgi:outer membrane protein assembly factor BamB
VKWKVKLADPGHSTPIISCGRIFLTQATKEGHVRSLLCFDRADGKLLWQRDVKYDAKERVWSGYCNASPATDRKLVVVSFASAGLYCFDFDGKEIWKRTDLGPFEHVYGNGASPVLYGDLAIFSCGPNDGKGGRNSLLAVEKLTGKTVWEHNEPGGWWGTPLITQVNGEDQLILGVPMKLKGLDPKTGEEIWFCDGLSKLNYTSPLVSNGIAVQMSGYGGAALAVKLGGSGDITRDRLWHHPKNIQRVGSGIIVGEHVYILEENGVPHCYELMTGKEVWQIEERTTRSWGSMVAADGRLYVLTQTGDTLVFAASPKYELLATNKLGDKTNASIAVSIGELFIRTSQYLWCIASPAKK